MTGFSAAVRRIIIERSSGWCEVFLPGCTGLALHKHHRRSRGMGSTKRPETNWASNGLDACLHCHQHIESNRAEALEYGWLVLQHQEPATVPVLYRGTWYLLSDDGGLEIVEQIGA